jgi:hypothetical protein
MTPNDLLKAQATERRLMSGALLIIAAQGINAPLLKELRELREF